MNWRMTRTGWLTLVAVAAVAIFALSFVDGWIAHDREVRGEGYRFVHVMLDAWRSRGMPVLTVGAVAALVVGALAAGMALRGWRLPAWLLPLGSALVLGILIATAWPISNDGHASSIDLTAGPLLVVGIGLAAVMLAASMLAIGPARATLAAAALVGLVAVVGGIGGRTFELAASQGDGGRHWSEGAYTRQASGGEPTETLVIGDGSVEIGDRWSGRWEWSGWTVSIDDDPACPGSRGTYHAHAVGEDDLRFVMIVDTCADGARAADLQTGIWERDQG